MLQESWEEVAELRAARDEDRGLTRTPQPLAAHPTLHQAWSRDMYERYDGYAPALSRIFGNFCSHFSYLLASYGIVRKVPVESQPRARDPRPDFGKLVTLKHHLFLVKPVQS